MPATLSVHESLPVLRTEPGRLRLQPLTPASVALVAALAVDPAAALALGLPADARGEPTRAAHGWLDAVHAEAVVGQSHVLAIGDGRREAGVVALREIGGDGARLAVAILPDCRRRGVGTFAAEQILLHAFQSLRLVRVAARARDDAGAALLFSLGFRAIKPALGEFSLTRAGWHAHRNAPVLHSLHPALRRVLEAELAAGNEIVETGRGWPEADSVLVKLRRAFTTPRDALPAGVAHRAVNDPHWWNEEFATAKPAHLLVC